MSGPKLSSLVAPTSIAWASIAASHSYCFVFFSAFPESLPEMTSHFAAEMHFHIWVCVRVRVRGLDRHFPVDEGIIIWTRSRLVSVS